MLSDTETRLKKFSIGKHAGVGTAIGAGMGAGKGYNHGKQFKKVGKDLYAKPLGA